MVDVARYSRTQINYEVWRWLWPVIQSASFDVSKWGLASATLPMLWYDLLDFVRCVPPPIMTSCPALRCIVHSCPSKPRPRIQCPHTVKDNPVPLSRVKLTYNWIMRLPKLLHMQYTCIYSWQPRHFDAHVGSRVDAPVVSRSDAPVVSRVDAPVTTERAPFVSRCIAPIVEEYSAPRNCHIFRPRCSDTIGFNVYIADPQAEMSDIWLDLRAINVDSRYTIGEHDQIYRVEGRSRGEEIRSGDCSYGEMMRYLAGLSGDIDIGFKRSNAYRTSVPYCPPRVYDVS